MSVVEIAFIAIPPHCQTGKWSSIIAEHAGTLVCVSLTPPCDDTNPPVTQEQWKKMVSKAAAANNHRVHIHRSFATMWDSDLCECSDFCALQVDGQDHIAESFIISLHDTATEHINLKCVHANCPKHHADICIQQAFAQVGKSSPYIIGGNFSMNTNLMNFTVSHAARCGTISTVPLVVPANDYLWPSPMILVRGPDAVGPSTSSQSHCAQLVLQVHGGATEHTPTRAEPAGSQGASSARANAPSSTDRRSALRDEESPLVDVIVLASSFLRFRFPGEHDAELKSVACDAAERITYEDGCLKELAKIADHFFFTKQGFVKDPRKMIEEMLRADRLGMQVKEELRNDSDATETEGDATELTKRVVSTCNKRWAEEFLQTRLTPEQQRDETYKLTYDDDGNVTLTGPQRSFVQAMLRKHMASKFVAYAIWQIGLPAFLKDDA